ncbi:unnamed protein product [Miscanthus lutarioriparius]|uniref:Protein kinase domain-containing protein n=1 Tax=Miscanthus lutarioriparius TaxID=422564 RepID=A0A811NSQ2_9POAL|nr:unnamed protein product [Miscanthus lutarioriparius]
MSRPGPRKGREIRGWGAGVAGVQGQIYRVRQVVGELQIEGDASWCDDEWQESNSKQVAGRVRGAAAAAAAVRARHGVRGRRAGRGRAGRGAAGVEAHAAGRRGEAGGLEGVRRVAVPVDRGVLQRGRGRVTELSLQFVDLHGGVPADLPASAVGATLTRLVLTGTNLTGPIPPQLSNLKNLLLWQNNLVGVIPPELGACAGLTVLDLSMNGLTGHIPASLGNLTSLQELQLSVNKVSGPIPAELARCTNLTDLELDNNQISGAIPAEIGKLTALRMLYLWANQLTGRIPPNIGGCASLESLDLSQSGPSSGCRGSSSCCSSTIPSPARYHPFSGEIPPEIGNCTSLVRFRASGNNLAGAIPPEVGKLVNLSFFDLSSNRLSGAIPAEISGCRNLTFVDLHGNAIAGVLPPGLFHDMLWLQYLDLSYNSIGGAIPSDIGKLGSLIKLVLGGNRLMGQIPQEIGSCSRLQLLDLGGNTLSGAIPASTGKIPGLEIALNLSCNGLSGAIPKEFGGLVRLGVLDVSHNQLSGDLQPLSALQNLVALNVSFNDFTGRAPATAFFAKLPTSDVEGDPGLCLSRCPGDASERERAARVATAVLVSALVALLTAAAFLLVGRHRRSSSVLFGGVRSDDDGKDAEMLPPWDVTLYQKLEISVGDVARSLTPANVIGQGWSGSMYRASVPSTGAAIAMKRFRSCDEASAEAFACEVGVLPRVRHLNIVRLLGWAANRRTRLLFYDYLPNGTLGGLLHSTGGSTGGAVVEWEVRLSIAIGVAEGLAYLHHDCAPAILHRDVKADNILLGERYEACLADFGLARVAEDGANSSPPPFAGSYGYIAPGLTLCMHMLRTPTHYCLLIMSWYSTAQTELRQAPATVGTSGRRTKPASH